MEITAIVSAVNGLKTATDIAKYIKDSGSSFEKAEAKLKLAELISALADVKMELADVQSLIIEKNETINKLQSELSLKSALVWEQPYYWLENESGKEGPFCQCCYDKDKSLARLQGNNKGWWKCSLCGNTYTDKSYRVDPPSRGMRNDPFAGY